MLALGQSSEVLASFSPGVPPCRLPPAGDLSGVRAGHCPAQRDPGVQSPCPSAGEPGGGLGLLGGRLLGPGESSEAEGNALWSHKGGNGLFPLLGALS